MGLTILMSLQASWVYHVHAYRASSLLHLQTSVAIVMTCALAQLDVFVCREIWFDLACRDQGVHRLLAIRTLRSCRVGTRSGTAASGLNRLHSSWAMSRWLYLMARNTCFVVWLCTELHVHV